MLQTGHPHAQLYQQAIALAKEIYRLTTLFPDTERAVLVYTLRRLAVTLCQHLALAAIKKGRKQTKFFHTCIDTCIALDTQLEIALAVDLIAAAEAADAITNLNAIYKACVALAQTK